MVKCINMSSLKSGRAVPNQYIIRNGKDIMFQSYTSTVAIIDKKTHRLTLGCDFDYSRTTARYLHQFINQYGGYKTREAIDTAPGGSYTNKLRYCIDHGIIDYNGRLV